MPVDETPIRCPNPHPEGGNGSTPLRSHLALAAPPVDFPQEGARLPPAALDVGQVRPSLGSLSRWRSVQKSNRIFPVMTSVQAKLVQPQVLRFSLRFVVPLIHCPKISPLRLVSSTLLSASEPGYILSVSTASPRVTFSMARDASCTNQVRKRRLLCCLFPRHFSFLVRPTCPRV